MKDQKIEDAAKLLGVKRQRVQTFCNQGRLDSYKKKNRVHITGDSLKRLIDERKGSKIVEKSGKKDEPDRYVDDIETKPVRELSSLSKVELALKAEKYKTQKLKNERDEKRLISVDDLSDRIFTYIRKLRDHQQNLPDALSDKLLASNTRHEVEQILREYETKGLNLIAENFNSLDENGLKKKIIQTLTQ